MPAHSHNVKQGQEAGTLIYQKYLISPDEEWEDVDRNTMLRFLSSYYIDAELAISAIEETPGQVIRTPFSWFRVKSERE